MSAVSLEGVQKLLNLSTEYPYFDSYEQHFEFFVDGVNVKAVAIVKWRSTQIDIIEPFQIEAWSFFPPSFAIEYSSVRRKEVLESKGISEIQDFIERTRKAYIRHVTYLRLKPQIDNAQDEFLSVFRDELDSLKTVEDQTKAHVDLATSILRKKFKSGAIDQKDYQMQVKKLKEESFNSHMSHWTLFRQVEMELDEIKSSMIDQVLSSE